MNFKRRWFWILLFICAALLLFVLATGWNVVLVRDYQRMVKLARSFPDFQRAGETRMLEAFLTLGTLGFVAALGAIILFFVRLLKEMKLNQLQSEFLATVSHELKSPIASIELSTSLIRSGGLSGEEQKQLWNSHDIELKRLREQVDHILEAARWQSQAPPLKPRKIVIEDWIGQSMERWRTMLGPGAELTREGEKLPVESIIDVRTLNMIVDNLFDNARKFSRGAPRVEIRTRRLPAQRTGRKRRWEICVQDQGWGFDPADARKIFDRFVRGHHEAPYAIPGTGLGLHLAKTASQALRMTLEGESEGVGKGARFILQGSEPSKGRSHGS